MNMYPLTSQIQETRRNNVQNESSTGPDNQHAIMRPTVEATKADAIKSGKYKKSKNGREMVELVEEHTPGLNVRDRTKLPGCSCRRVWFRKKLRRARQANNVQDERPKSIFT